MMINMNKALLGFCCILIAAGVKADPKELFYQRYLANQAERQGLLASDTIKTGYFEQLIDHADAAKGTFLQRYYVDESFADNDDAPVFLYICGEGVCAPRSLMLAIRDHAEKYHAKLIALEHRFYGKSQPFDTLSTEHLAYLSTGNALKDLARFERYVQKEWHWTGKWVAFGGSYPGSLSAFYREKYPELVIGSLASSAPVEARENFEAYDAHVTKVAGLKCAQDMRESVRFLEEGLADPDRRLETKALFDAETIENDVDFLYLAADIGAAAVQYGFHEQFCQAMHKADHPVEGYANFAKWIFKNWHVDPVDFTPEAAMSENPEDFEEMIGLRQWYWQSCTEYGYWQNAHSDPNQSTRSSLINLEYHRDVCKRLFGIETPVDAGKTNATYYEGLRFGEASRIFLTNGGNDPWMNLSLAIPNGNTDNHALDYYVIEGSAHCADLHIPSPNDSKYLKEARRRLSKLIGKWLKD